MTIATDLHSRLTAALGEAVPVLLPEQIELPKSGRTPGQPGGIAAYLQQHPQGYVQIERPTPITSDGTTATYWVTVASLHGTLEGVTALARAVRLTLNGTPLEPGPHREVTPAQPELLSPGVWLVRPTFETLTIDGQTVN